MKQQRGSVIIIVLWTSILLTVLVTVMAGKVQLSARTAFHNRTAVSDLAAITEAMNKAEMELMLDRMMAPVERYAAGFDESELPSDQQLDVDGNLRMPAHRFNGQALTLNYPTSENMVVRIYDHAGKINLNRIRRQDLQLIIEKRLGPDADPQQVQELMGAWIDWTDLNDLAGINGAERDYYETLDPPYSPRNNPELDNVEELLLIKGFDEVFQGVNLDAAFTTYGNGQSVNLNLATREAMQLLPGLNDELIEKIIHYRQERDIRNTTVVGEIVPLENLVELSPWLGSNTSSFYSVFAYPAQETVAEVDVPAADAEGLQRADPVTQAYMEIMEVRSYAEHARVYKVDPYGRLPDTAPAHVEE